MAGTALLAALGLLLCSCTRDGKLGDSRQQVQQMTRAAGWSVLALVPSQFQLLALSRQRGAAQSLTVYIEGDGAAWPSAFQPPRDPTPQQSLVLQLAEQDPAPAVAYLGRPCQYLAAQALPGCAASYWTKRRFAPEVVTALDAALSQLKQHAGAEQLRLVGYSGGGVLATLLAQRREDVAVLLTVAAPLALAEWVDGQGLTPLTGSLDPQVEVGQLPTALHFVGTRDAVVPPALLASFVAEHGGSLQLMSGYDHACCWVKHWPALLARVPFAEQSP